MSMEKLKHFSHECELTSPEMTVDGVCNICHKDDAVKFACKSCDFDLCKKCSKLPRTVSRDFHPEHPLELCLFQNDRKPIYIICSGCGNMSSASFYECKACEIYLDLACALQEGIVKAWDDKELLHDSHVHLLRRCRPGPDAQGSCLLCELPVSPSSICYGCAHCYSFVHQDCVGLPREIHHPVHLAHPLKRQSYLRILDGQTSCSACKLKIDSVPYSCLECGIDLHMRCADSLLRALMHKSHEHKLFYVASGARLYMSFGRPCHICMRKYTVSLDSYYHCVECDLHFHFECLEIPEFLIKKSYHTHPLVCKIFLGKDGSFEFCDLCETIVREGCHAYSCEECDFLGHIECILREEEPSPLYLKDLYSCGDYVTGATNQEDYETNIMVNDVKHIHVMRPTQMSELYEWEGCNICEREILGTPYKCTTCDFQTHQYCAELGQPSKNRLLHLKHPLTLQPQPRSWDWDRVHCDNCRKQIKQFYLLCRICNFTIDIRCALKGKPSLGMIGQKIIGEWKTGYCLNNNHKMVQVLVSASYLTGCAICSEKLQGKSLSCITCGEIYHFRCIEVWRRPLLYHPIHSNHILEMKVTTGDECVACKKNIAKHKYSCFECKISFHSECLKAMNISRMIKSHIHNLYSFWMGDSKFTQNCSVCARPCGASFYGCVGCNFNAHVECLGFATYVRSHLHQHSAELVFGGNDQSCALCGSDCSRYIYSCRHCSDVFHIKCLMPTDDREAATEEEQLCDIYLMYLERNLFDVLDFSKSESESGSSSSD